MKFALISTPTDLTAPSPGKLRNFGPVASAGVQDRKSGDVTE